MIAIQEKIIDGETGIDINFLIVKNNIELQIVDKFVEYCKDRVNIQGIDILYHFGETSYITFKYEDFTYYISTMSLSSQEEILSLVEELLP